MSSRHLFFRVACQLRNYLWWRHLQEEESEGKEGREGKYADLAGDVVGIIWSSHSVGGNVPGASFV